MIYNKQTTYVFIDASNLFYGGEKNLGWKIDYQKLLEYLKEKYEISKALYFGGVEIHNFKYDYLNNNT
ncbi:MAG: NYN domain-containing protein, partial [Patescibacteria group bacterium]